MSNFIRLFACYLCLTSLSWAVNLNTDSALALWLKLDDGTGTTASDTSGNGRDGTISGAAWTAAGRLAHALDCDGEDDRVSVGHAAALIGTPLTVAMWINPDTWSVSLKTVGTKDESGTFEGWYLRRSSTNAINAVISVGGTFHTAAGPSDVTTGAWQHVALTYDGETLICYRNGAAGTAVTAPSGAIDTNSSAVELGRDPLASGREFDGRIDDARIYSRALSAPEIKRLYDMRIQPVRAGATIRRRR